MGRMERRLEFKVLLLTASASKTAAFCPNPPLESPRILRNKSHPLRIKYLEFMEAIQIARSRNGVEGGKNEVPDSATDNFLLKHFDIPAEATSRVSTNLRNNPPYSSNHMLG